MPKADRQFKRWPKRVQVRFWVRGKPDKVFTAFTRDISEGGAFLSTNHTFREKSRLQIEFVTDHGGFLLEGQVMRSKSYPRELQQVKTGGMGIRFLPIRDLLKEVMPSGATSAGAVTRTSAGLKKASPERVASALQGSPSEAPTGRIRRTRGVLGSGDGSQSTDLRPRPSATTEFSVGVSEEAAKGEKEQATPAELPNQTFTQNSLKSRAYVTGEIKARPPETGKQELGEKVLPEFPVAFASSEDFLDVFEKDLRFGGLFVSTPNPARMEETIELVLELPEGAGSVRVSAKVVHVMGPESGSKETNLLAGMGVHFTDDGTVSRLQKIADDLSPS